MIDFQLYADAIRFKFYCEILTHWGSLMCCPLYNGLQIVVPGLSVCLCIFSMFVNALTKQEFLLVWGNVLKKMK